MNAKDLFDMEVVGSNGWKIGKVKDLVIDPKIWQASALLIELEKSVASEFSLKHRLSRTQIPLSVNLVQGVGDRVVLKSSKEEVFQQVATAADTEVTKSEKTA
jgi:sporulation protein YlmC with PRC-barrel domain